VQADATAAIAFCDLRSAHAAQAERIEQALIRVARSGRYILGPEVESFEREFATVCGAGQAIGVGSGTDALALILRAAGIGAGDEVVVPAYTAAATWMAVAMVGANPVGADVDPESGLVDPEAVRAVIGPRARAVICVHLFGRLAAVDELGELSTRHGLMLVEDAAQAAGVDEGSGPAGAHGAAAAFSFYPTKTLGCLGDGGAVVTDDRQLAKEVRRLRSYGWGEWQGQVAAPGVNSRLDEIQAAILRLRLRELSHSHTRLRALAARYRRLLTPCNGVTLPRPPANGEAPWHQFVLRSENRDELRSALRELGVETAIHYEPIPAELEAFQPQDRFPGARALARSALSLPFDPWLSDDQADAVCAAVSCACATAVRSSM
jgi:dTDP-3-amino-3,4,6-trideoxy-alpha-D-glucose transaminase